MNVILVLQSINRTGNELSFGIGGAAAPEKPIDQQITFPYVSIPWTQRNKPVQSVLHPNDFHAVSRLLQLSAVRLALIPQRIKLSCDD